VAWLLGCLALLFVTSSGLGRYMPAMFSMHMADHMMLSMLVPILLALGGPVSLALRALPTAGRDDPPGMREWLLAALHSRLSRFLTNPVVATVLFIAGFYGLYLGGLFDAAVGSHMGHVAMNVHFLVSGYLFYWVVIGVDPTPRPIPPLAKVGVVFASLPLHAFFGVLLMSMPNVLGESFYRSLHLSWHTDLLGDQRLGGGIAWAAGEIPLVVVMIALLVQWTRSDQRTARRLDRAADRDDDAERAAYNAMLAELARRDTSRPQPLGSPRPSLFIHSRGSIHRVRPRRADPSEVVGPIGLTGASTGGEAAVAEKKGMSNVRNTADRGGQHRQRPDPSHSRRPGSDEVPSGEQFAASWCRRQMGGRQLAVRHRQLLGPPGLRCGRVAG
jgi:cytochrome c oxidase assembly factor CtaG